ncbi:hypothetical protein [Streptomyces sp. NPDC126499]|uniref:hypothetical protein n=1 Tax=Streptomyces sp. NPDC126499 TaxID=3155314 RepID=UPI00332D1153
MSVRHMKKAGRGMASVAMAAGLVIGLAGCGQEEKPPQDKPTTTSSADKGSTGSARPQSEAPTEPIAVLKGQEGLELSVHSATRDEGGFITVKGELKNTSDDVAVISSHLSGDETEIVKHGNSLGGATLLDSTGKKRYYVLRDTDGRPLTTTRLSTLAAGAETPVFMQFPAPPPTTTAVSLQLPTFDPATIKLS